MLTPLQSIIPGVNISNLVSLEEISKGYTGGPLANGSMSTHPRKFAWQFFKGSDYLVEAAKSFEGQIVVDLGAGENLDGYILANIAGAQSYIAVEPWNIQRLYPLLSDNEKLKGDPEINGMIESMMRFIGTIPSYDKDLVKRIQERVQAHLKGGPRTIPTSVAAEDILTFLRRLPTDSVSLLACGIDRCMIGNDEYASQVEEEITRTLNPKGAYLGMCSRFRPSGLRKDEAASDKNFFEKFTI